jgi:hypothetical protein
MAEHIHRNESALKEKIVEYKEWVMDKLYSSYLQSTKSES